MGAPGAVYDDQDPLALPFDQASAGAGGGCSALKAVERHGGGPELGVLLGWEREGCCADPGREKEEHGLVGEGLSRGQEPRLGVNQLVLDALLQGNQAGVVAHCPVIV